MKSQSNRGPPCCISPAGSQLAMVDILVGRLVSSASLPSIEITQGLPCISVCLAFLKFFVSFFFLILVY